MMNSVLTAEVGENRRGLSNDCRKVRCDGDMLKIIS